MNKFAKNIFGVCLLVLIFSLSACSKKTNTASNKQARSTIPTYDGSAHEKVASKKSKKTSKRMKKGDIAPTKNAFAETRRKEYKKLERIKNDPKYTDAMYFGHKKKPKKRKRGKRKFCKECGMTH
ncbi:MAG: hypothetical protein ACJAWV_001318 [Flammeovirgaceae bacterium]|jgi:hypothetical protein